MSRTDATTRTNLYQRWRGMWVWAWEEALLMEGNTNNIIAWPKYKH